MVLLQESQARFARVVSIHSPAGKSPFRTKLRDGADKWPVPMMFERLMTASIIISDQKLDGQRDQHEKCPYPLYDLCPMCIDNPTFGKYLRANTGWRADGVVLGGSHQARPLAPARKTIKRSTPGAAVSKRAAEELQSDFHQLLMDEQRREDYLDLSFGGNRACGCLVEPNI